MSSSPQIVPLWITIAGIFGVGSLVGGLITQYLSSKQRHREWLKDNKKQEWRELISTLSRSVRYILDNSFGVVSGEQERGLLQANAEARSVIEDRILIAPQVQPGTSSNDGSCLRVRVTFPGWGNTGVNCTMISWLPPTRIAAWGAELR
jgi:hypothetical protein